jgi:hypothetical protein
VEGFHATWLWISQAKLICKFNIRLTKFATQIVVPSSKQAWFHTQWNVERTNPTHLVYKLSSKAMEVDDGDVEVLRAEMEEREWKFLDYFRG